MDEIKTIKEIDAYYDVKENRLYLTNYAEGCKVSDFCLDNISLEEVKELLTILQSTGIICDLRTSEINVKELWN